VDTGVSATAPALAGFDPGPEIRRSVRGQERHVPRLRAATRDLLRFAVMSEASRGEALDSRLASLRLALWRSPFHCEALRRHGLSPGDLRALRDLRHFPLLGREALGAAFAEIPSLPPPGEDARLFVDRSSGSTGQPVAVLKHDYESVHMWAVLRFWMRRLGRRLPARPRVALLCTLPHGVEYRTPLPALGGGTLARVSIVRPDPAARLSDFRPHVVFTDPAGLHWLASQVDPPRPRLLLSSAMHLSPSLRRRVEGVVGAPVLNYYSTAETGPLAWECLQAAGRFHVLLPEVWLESVEGDLVVTRMRESVLPLLRYLPGDRGEVRADACACGYRGPSIVGLSGRRACAFVAPDGREVDAWQLAWAFQHHPLDGFRLTQESVEAFRLEMAGDERGTAAALERLRASLTSLGWDAPQIACRRVPPEALAFAKPQPFVSSFRGAPSASGDEGSAGSADSSGPVPPESLGVTRAQREPA
jgi:phenylacetate-CoA ligase